MIDAEIERYDQLLVEIKQKRRAALKRKREQERRKEKRRREVIGNLCVEHGDAALMERIDALLKAHVPVADMPLWPDLFPEQAPEANRKTPKDEPPGHWGEPALDDLQQTTRHQPDDPQDERS